jgi:hypothetical protein
MILSAHKGTLHAPIVNYHNADGKGWRKLAAFLDPSLSKATSQVDNEIKTQIGNAEEAKKIQDLKKEEEARQSVIIQKQAEYDTNKRVSDQKSDSEIFKSKAIIYGSIGLAGIIAIVVIVKILK